MAQVINTNIASLNAQRNLNSSQSATTTSLQRLSTGLRINSAKDDAAGLAISERMSTQIKGLNQAVRNSNDGISLAQTAEGALQQIGTNLQRIRELSVQSANATNSADDRAALQKEVAQLSSEIGRVAKDTSFNGTSLIDGSFTSKAFQVGANQGQTISINSIANANVNALGSWTSTNTKADIGGIAPTGTDVAAVPGEAVLTAANLKVTATDDGSGNFVIGDSTFTLNGVQVNVTGVATADAAASADDAKAAFLTNLATAVTNANVAGVTASVAGTELTISNTGAGKATVAGDAVVGSFTAAAQTPAGKTFAGLAGDTFKINGVSIEAIGATTNEASRLNALATAINNKSAESNVTATVDSGRLKLSSDKGDITISAGANLDGTPGTAGAGTVAQLSAALSKETGLVLGTTGAAVTLDDATSRGATFTGGTEFKTGTQQTGFANLDISTVEGANNAVLAMDAALKSVNEARADLGAIQNRFSSVVSSLETTSENLSASRSRIQDTDFAAETASLTRAQILSQAGTAMLAQANSLPNNVLTLLRG